LRRRRSRAAWSRRRSGGCFHAARLNRLLRFAGALHGAVDGGAGDGEQLGQFGAGVLSRTPEFNEVRFLGWLELGLLAAQPAIARPFSWNFTHNDLEDLLYRIDAHDNRQPHALAA
jgi:hypothetical protein